MLNLFNEALVALLLAATTTGTTEIASGGVDTKEYDGVAFILELGSHNAGNIIKIQGSPDNSTWSDIAGSKYIPVADAVGVVMTVERSPAFRYYQVDVIRAGATTTISAIFSILYRTKSAPITGNLGTQNVGAIAGTA